MKKIWFGVLVLTLAFYCGAATAEVKVRLDFGIDNPDAIISEACRAFVEEFSTSFDPPQSDLVDKFMNFDKNKDEFYISAIRGEYGDLVVFIVPDAEVTDGYDIVALEYPDLDIISVGGAIIEPNGWDVFYEVEIALSDPDIGMYL